MQIKPFFNFLHIIEKMIADKKHTEQLDAILRALQDKMPDKQADVA